MTVRRRRSAPAAAILAGVFTVRPGGNVTGANQITVEVAAKRLELLHELLPNAHSMAVLINPAGPNAAAVSKDTQAVGATLGLQLHLIDAMSTSEIDNAFAEAVRLNASAMVVGTDPFSIQMLTCSQH